MKNTVISGKAKQVFRLLELKAKYEEAEKARRQQQDKKNSKQP